jgi:hypothetical protein
MSVIFIANGETGRVRKEAYNHNIRLHDSCRRIQNDCFVIYEW